MIVRTEHASVGQRMLWLLDRFGAGQGELNYPLLIRLRGPLDVAALTSALSTLIGRHEALRTTFARRRGLLTQLIAEPAPVELARVRVQPATLDALNCVVMAEVSEPVDPRVQPLRATLWELAEADHVLCLNLHHLVADAWSCRVLADELTSLLAGETDLPRPGWQYRHFVQWQRRAAGQRRQAADREYWQAQLDGAAGPSLPSQRQPGGQDAAAIEVELGAEGWAALRGYAKSAGTTAFAVLLSVFYLALRQETGDNDLCVSAPFANRELPETMRTIGFFATFLPLRVQVPPSAGFPETLAAVRTAVRDAITHQGFPYQLPDRNPAGSPAGRRLEDVVFQMLPPLPPVTAAGALDVEILPPRIASRFELEFCAIPHDAGLQVLVQTAPGRGDPAMARRVADTYLILADEVASMSDKLRVKAGG